MVDHTEETERGCQLPSTLDMGSKTSRFCLAPFVFHAHMPWLKFGSGSIWV